MAFKQIIGTGGNDTTIKTTPGQQDVVLALAGDDQITADFQSADYIIGGDGQDTLKTTLSYSNFKMEPHPTISKTYLLTYTPTDSTSSTISIVKDVENFQFEEGTCTLNQFLTDTPDFNGTDPDVNIDNTFTLKMPAGTAGTMQSVLMWGYNPDEDPKNPEEGKADGGIPATELISFLKNIAGVDFLELGFIDDDGVDPATTLSNISNITIGDITSDSMSTVTITTNDGKVISAEASLGEDYLNFLGDLIFDEEGNSRLYMKEVVTGATPAGPIVLTTEKNNGSTIETGYTTAGNDLIVAGRLDILHNAYIDGGAGYNILEVDAKGVYAQPKSLANIQEISVQNLPNVYGDTSPGEWVGQAGANSILDLSRATELKKLVITEGLDTGADLGTLTIVGIRNAAVARFEGGFTEEVTLHYGRGIAGELSIQLAVGDVTTGFNIVHNASVLNIDSQGIENHLHDFNAGDGSLSQMVVTGAGIFAVDEDLAKSFNAARPAIIDASKNTGGLDVTLNGHYNLTIKGTKGKEGKVTNDEITAKNSKMVVIAVNDGANVIDVSNSEIANITSGSGSDNITAENIATVLNINAGDGNNVVKADGSNKVVINAGTGDDRISALNCGSIEIKAGDGNNTVYAGAASLTITTGAGNDTLVLSGSGTDLGVARAANRSAADSLGSANGALLTIDMGAGENTVRFGDDALSLPGVTALQGSTITGENIKISIDKPTDLTQATLSGITSVILENGMKADGTIDNPDTLSITSGQFHTLGAAVFKVYNDSMANSGLLNIVVTEDTVLSNLVTLSELSSSIKLTFDIMDGKTLTMTAEQLHKYVAPDGISVDDSAVNGYINNQVVITNAGVNFDPFDNQNGGNGGGTIDNSVGTKDVTIIREPNGYTRPGETPYSDSLTITATTTNHTFDGINAGLVPTVIFNSDELMTINGNVNATSAKTLNLIGDTNMVFTNAGVVNLASGFTVDFSKHTASVTGLEIANFQNITVDDTPAPDAATFGDPNNDGRIIGNGGARIDVQLGRNIDVGGVAGATLPISQVGAPGNGNGLKSSGVVTYVVTKIADINLDGQANDTATFYVCDSTQGLQSLGLQGNAGQTIDFKQVNWTTQFLLEGDGKTDWSELPKVLGNPNQSNIGTLKATFFEDGGPAVVNISNQGTALGVTSNNTPRPLHVDGIDIDNADSMTLKITDGNAIIKTVAGNSVNDFKVVSANNVTVQGTLDNLNDVVADNFGELTTLDASAVTGTFTLDLNRAGNNDLSHTIVSGVEKVIFGVDPDPNAAPVKMTVTVDQAMAIGLDNFSTSDTNHKNGTLNLENLSTQVIDVTKIDVGDIGTLSVVDVADVDGKIDGTVTLDPGTVLGNTVTNVDSVVIKALTSNTTVEMTAAQFNQIANAAPDVEANLGTNTATGDKFVATLVLTNVTNDKLDLSEVGNDAGGPVSVVVRVKDVVATDKMIITGHAATLEVTGTVDLTHANTVTITNVTMADSAVLTMTASQVAAITIADANHDGKADNWVGLAGATLNIIGLSDQALNLDAIAAAGINIGTITIADTNAPIVLNAATTLGGADSIVTPTDAKDGIEDTSLTLTAAQFNQLDGKGTITGGAAINITNLVNNTDSDALVPLTPDVAVIDVSGIAAPKGTVTLGAPTVTLAETANIAGFEIQLGANQMIQFSTALQANGAKITETVQGTTTAVAWLFDTLGSVTQIDTKGYDADINTLFVNKELVDGQNEENLWTWLAEYITVQKVSLGEIPATLWYFDRINTFEALTDIDGVTFNDLDKFQTIENLTLNLEGDTSIGNVVIDDTVGEGGFKTLTINSYQDPTTIPERIIPEGEQDNFKFHHNEVGNISLSNTPMNELVNVVLNTYDDVDNIIDTPDDAKGYLDPVNVNGAAAERDGLGLEVGTIKFAANTAKTATLTLTGHNDIKIAGVDISDAEVSLLKIDASQHTATTGLHITGINGGSELASFDTIFVMDGHTAPVPGVATPAEVLGDVDVDNKVSVLLEVISGTNDLTMANLNVDNVRIDAGTLTLTAEQIAAVGFADANADGKADAWVGLTTAKLNIVDMDATAILDLNKVAAAGIDIGTITLKNTDGVIALNAATTLGGADSIITPTADPKIDGATEKTSLSLTAQQFADLDGAGTITGGSLVNITNLHNTLDTSVPASASTLEATTIDVTGITARHGSISLDANDVKVDATSKLGSFSITLDDVNSTGTANELAGQTIRFTTAAQAERQIIVTGEDGVGVWQIINGESVWVNDKTPDDAFERDTNVVWDFAAISGTKTGSKIDTSSYDNGLGRVWISDALVNGKNVEDIFSSPSQVATTNPTTGLPNLNSTTIIRVENTADLGTLLPENQPISRTLEIEAFTKLPLGLTFENKDKLVGVQNLTLDMGGEVTIGALSIDNVIATPVSNNDEFGTLTINSLLADNPNHYLLPEGWILGTNRLPTDVNTIGAISSGPDRSELSRVTINATGVGLNTGTITFTDNPARSTNDKDNPIATLTVTGSKNVKITSVDTADADITSLVVDTTDYTGTLTAPGASPSPAFNMNATETLIFSNGRITATVYDNPATKTIDEYKGAATINLGGTTNAGISSDTLSVIDASNFGGRLNLGTIQIDGTNDDNNKDGDTLDAGDTAFTFTAGADSVATMTLATVGSTTLTLKAQSNWVFDFTGAHEGSALTLDSTAVLETNSNLTLNNVPLVIHGNVSSLNNTNLDMTGGSIQVPEGQTLTLSLDKLTTIPVDITGEGKIVLTGDASTTAINTTHLKTENVDLAGLAFAAGGGLNINLSGAIDDDKALTGVNITTGNGADNIIASADADTIVAGAGNDTITGGLGADNIDGGGGTDVFKFSINDSPFTTTGMDTITDFKSGTDRIMLMVNGVETPVAFMGNFTDLIAADNAVTSGSIQGAFNKTAQILYIDTNKDGFLTDADLAIKMTNVSTMVAEDVGVDTTPPLFNSATVNGNTLVMTYNDTNLLNSTNIPAKEAFAVAGNTISSVAVNGSNHTVTLTLGTAVVNGATGITVTYTDPTAGNDVNAIQDIDGNDAATITRSVSNITPDTTSPVFVQGSATVNGSTLVMTYNELNNLDAVNVPAVDAFIVSGNTVTKVDVNATAKTVTLTLGTPVVNGQVVTVTYSDPTADNDVNAIQDASGNDAVTIIAIPVTNTTSDTTPPVFSATASVPADDGTTMDVSDNIVLHYNEPVAVANAAGITLLDASNTVINATVTAIGNTIVINPVVNLANDTVYHVNVAANAITDTAPAHNPADAITDETTYNFTTVAVTPVDFDTAAVGGVYNAVDGAEEITINAANWDSTLEIKGFNLAEDKLIISGEWANAADFIAANPTGESGALTVGADGVAHLSDPNFNEIIIGGNVPADTTLTQAVANGWIEFVKVSGGDDVVKEVNLATDSTNGSYAATTNPENFTIKFADLNKSFEINGFDKAEDKLIIDGDWDNVQEFIDDNSSYGLPFGVNPKGDFVIYFEPNVDAVSLIGANVPAETTLESAVTAGWIQFV